MKINFRDYLIQKWQEFEKKYKISEKYYPYEQLIFTAFEAGADTAQSWEKEPSRLEQEHKADCTYNCKATFKYCYKNPACCPL